MNNRNLRGRIPYLDVLRVVACVLVLLIHAPMYKVSQTTPSPSFAAYLTLFTVSSKLFFMLSGALLLPVQISTRSFVFRRLKVVLIPLLVWSVIYLLEHIFLLQDFHWRMLLSAPFTPVEESLWFVYVMAVVYLVLPLLSKCVISIGKRGVEYLILFWVLSSLIPYQHGIFIGQNQITHNMFGAFANVLGYVLLGYYLHNHPLPLFTKRHWWKFALAFTFGIVVMPLFEFIVQPHFGISYAQAIGAVTSDVSINALAMGTLLFSVVQHFAPASYSDGKPHRFCLILSRISICTYGIYLGHMLIMRQVVWPFMIHYLPDIQYTVVLGFITAGITFVITYAIMRIINLTPLSKAVIGRSNLAIRGK